MLCLNHAFNFSLFPGILGVGLFHLKTLFLEIPYDLDCLTSIVIYLALLGALMLICLVFEGRYINTGFLHSGDQSQTWVYGNFSCVPPSEKDYLLDGRRHRTCS